MSRCKHAEDSTAAVRELACRKGSADHLGRLTARDVSDLHDAACRAEFPRFLDILMLKADLAQWQIFDRDPLNQYVAQVEKRITAMPLKLNLKPGEAMLVNGALIRNTTQHRQILTIETQASVLRQKDVLSTERANRTPAGILHAEIVACLAKPGAESTHIAKIHGAIAQQMADADADHAAALRTVRRMVEEGNFHKALRALDPVRLEQERRLTPPVAANPD